MKKKILMVMLALLFVPAGANAQVSNQTTMSALLAQINALTQIIQSLQTQIVSLQTYDNGVSSTDTQSTQSGTIVSNVPAVIPTVNISSNMCVNIGSALYIGKRGSEVTKLQTYLKTQGTYTYPRITGYFGPATELAVKKWQARMGIVSYGTANSTGYGVVGPKTSEKIRSMSCGVSAISNPVDVSQTTAVEKPTVTLSASRTSIVSDGKPGPVTLYWSSTDASYCNFEKQTLATSGSMNISVGATGTFNMSCTGSGGTTLSNPVTITFQDSAQTQIDPHAPVITHVESTGNPNFTVTAGASAYIRGLYIPNINAAIILNGVKLDYGVQNDGSLNVSIPANTTPGFKTLRVQNSNNIGTNIGVTVTVPTQNPSITVLRPNGGEILDMSGEKDVNLRVNWDYANMSGNIAVYLHFPDGGTCFLSSVPVENKTFATKIDNGHRCSNIPRNITPGQYKILLNHELTDGQRIKDSSDNFFSFAQSASTQNPSINISASSDSQNPSSNITVKIGEKFNISGTPVNLEGQPYNFGSNTAQSEGYSRSYSFIQEFGNNNSCGNNAAESNPVWVMNCLAKSPGSSHIRVDIHKGGKVYRSNTVYVTVLDSLAPVVTSISPQTAHVGKSLTAYFSNGGNTGSVILKTLDGSKTWHIPYTTGRVHNGFTFYDGSKVTFTVPSTIGRGLLPENTGYEAPIPLVTGQYNLTVYNTGCGATSGPCLDDPGTSAPYKINITNQSASLTVLSPNGGEQWQVGSTQKITWNTKNVNYPDDKITIYIIPAEDPSKNINLAQSIPNTGSYNYLVDDPAKFSSRSSWYKAGNKFKIFVCAAKRDSNSLCSNAIDHGDDFFTIASSTSSENAGTIANLIATINALEAQIVRLSGSPSSYSYSVVGAGISELSIIISNLNREIVAWTTNLSISTDSQLPNATVGKAYSTEISTTGGVSGAGSTGRLVSGSLPPGITFSTCSTNVCVGLGGTPTSSGKYTFAITIKQGLRSVSKTFTINVEALVAVDRVTLNSVKIENGNAVVSFSKNFNTCAHLINESGQLVHIQNHFCFGGTTTIPAVNLTVTNGQKVKLCHGNNRGICSDYVSVEAVIPDLKPVILSVESGAADANTVHGGELGYVTGRNLAGIKYLFFNGVGVSFQDLTDNSFAFTVPEISVLSGTMRLMIVMENNEQASTMVNVVGR
jgi:peptidoglycan hydrolase-like protein with peptidoglycan-binding domain